MAFDFNGSTDYVTQTAVPQVGAGSIGGWLNCDAFPSGTDKMIVLSFYEESQSEFYTTYDKTIYFNSSGQLKAYIYDGGAKRIASGSLSTGVWVHFLAVFDGSNLRMYINGSDIGSTAAGNSYTGYSNPSIRICGKVSALEGEVTRVRFDGKLAEMGIWTRGVTAAEAVAMAAGYSPLCFQQGLVSHIPFVRNLIDSKLDAPTASGTSVADHPRIIYPRASKPHIVSAAASGPVIPVFMARARQMVA